LRRRRGWPRFCYAISIVVRLAHRTLPARILAVCLLAFALSPVTAPFTTCDLADFMQSHPADHAGHHPGRQMAEARVRTAPHLVTMAFEIAPSFAAYLGDEGAAPTHTVATEHLRHDLRSILRL
jgi:hypothetical protein